MPNHNLLKVLYHEVGHFVAHEIIRRQLGVHGLEKIIIIPRGTDYEGQSVPLKPEGHRQDTDIQNHAELIVELFYGCFIQTIYIGDGYKGFSHCFEYPTGNGREDIEKCSYILNEFGTHKKRQVFELIFQYCGQNLRDSNSLRSLLPSPVEMENYLISIDNEQYNIDLSRLQANSVDLITNLQAGLLQLIEKIRSILIA